MQSENIRIIASIDSIMPTTTSRFLAPYRQKLQDSFSTVIATSTGDLVKSHPGGSLGNLITTALWYYTKNNTPGTSQAPIEVFVLMNYGGIRLNKIYKGDITIHRIFELIPFENTLVRIQVTGAELKQLIHQLNKEDGWPMKFNANKFKNLEDINVGMRFELITNNYIAQGGDNCSILTGLPQEDTGILIRDILLDFLKIQKEIIPDSTQYWLK